MRRQLGDLGRGMLVCAASALLFAACASPGRQAEDYAAQGEWMKAVMTYRKVYAEKPTDVEYRSRLKQTELKAADFFYQRGVQLQEQGDLDAAMEQFQQGLVAMPEHSKLQQAVAELLARKEADQLYREGMTFKAAGKPTDARRQLEKALDTYPWHKQAEAALMALKAEEEGKLSEGLALNSNAPVTLNFRQTDLKQAFEFLGKSFGVNVIYDEGTKSVPVTLYGKDVTFDEGLNLLLATTKMFYKRIGPNTILIAPDTKEKRGQYEDHVVRTFQLNVVRAKDMADILKALLNVKKISLNEALNTIAIRDNEDVVKLAERIVENNDRLPAEIILDVEILEVNRTKSEKLGLDLGSYEVSAALAAATATTAAATGTTSSTSTSTTTTTATPPGTIPLGGSFARSLSAAVLTLPTATFRFYKQDVDAHILANPKIRVTSGKPAKIHVGDRVPLRTSSILDATGQTRDTFDYKEIGIRLSVEPVVNLDNSANVKLSLEVSSLGANLGTPAAPAYVIGTRNAETVMTLRDGETAILGGLIRDEEQNTRVRVPGLGDIPAIGTLFRARDKSGDRTDVLLTITPRIVRGWDVPTRALREFYSGTETVYSDKPVFGTLATGAPAPSAPAPSAPAATPPASTTTVSSEGTPAAKPPESGKSDATAPRDKATKDAADGANTVGPSETGGATLSFDKAVYEVAAGQDIDVGVLAANLPGGASVPLEIVYDPQLLTYVAAVKADIRTSAFDASTDPARGAIDIGVTLPSGAGVGSDASVARLTLHGAKPGVSYLVFRTPTIKDSNGDSVAAQLRASRVVIK
jgi:general secretion pathway protein D